MISVISVNVLEGGTRLREAVSSAEHPLKDLTLEDCLSAALSVSKQWPGAYPSAYLLAILQASVSGLIGGKGCKWRE